MSGLEGSDAVTVSVTGEHNDAGLELARSTARSMDAHPHAQRPTATAVRAWSRKGSSRESSVSSMKLKISASRALRGRGNSDVSDTPLRLIQQRRDLLAALPTTRLTPMEGISVPWLALITLGLLIVGVVAYAGPRGKIRRYGPEPWALILGFLLLLFALAFRWATA